MLNKQSISQKLIQMSNLDQEIRERYEQTKDKGDLKEMQKIDKINREEFKQIFKTTGLITSEYGKDAQLVAFLLVQHMPRSEISFMKRYLSLMKKNLEDIEPLNFAMLCDRVETWQNKPQIYGTQFVSVENKDNTFKLKELKDPELVDKRRKDIGLEPLTDYIKKLSKERNVKLIF